VKLVCFIVIVMSLSPNSIKQWTIEHACVWFLGDELVFKVKQ